MDSLVNMEVCRVCLAISAKMHHMSKYKLIAMFERVVGVEINEEDILPKMLCWECAARLLSAYNFIDKAFKTHWILVTKLFTSKIVTMSDIESIDKSQYQLESTLGIKVSKETDSNVYIINENDKGNDHYNIENHINDGGSVPESCELIDISIKDKHIIITEANVSDNEDPPNSEYLEGIVEQNVADKNYKEANVSGANNNIKFQNKNSVIQTLEQETTTDNVSNVSEMSEEKNPILDEAIEVCEKIKQSRKRKHDSVTGQRNRSSEGVLHGKRKKKLREVSEDEILLSTKHNKKDSFKKLTAQSWKDSRTANPSQIKKEILEQKNKLEKTSRKETTGTADSNIRLLQEDSISSKNVFICDICHKEFNIKNTLIRHIRQHSKIYRRTLQSNKAHPRNKVKGRNSMNMDTIFICDYCGYESFVKQFLRSHINKLHNKRKSYNCSLCNYKTYYRSCLPKHIDIKHFQNKVYNCSDCNYKSLQKSNLTRHMNTTHTKRDVYNCSLCSFKAYKKCSLSYHMNAKHTKTKVYSCSLCNYKTCHRSGLPKHMNTKHSKKNFYNCSYCSYKTYQKDNLARHTNAKHTKTDVYNCSFCSYEAYKQTSLSNHINDKHTKNISYDCSLCSFKSYKKCSLSYHMNSKHTETDVYSCSLCNYKAYQKIHLTTHINTIHTKKYVYNCSQCSYKAYNKSSLSYHVNAKHNKKDVFKCSLCSYKAYHKGNLTVHVNAAHTKTNVYICSHCSYKAYHKGNLISHINTKHT